MNVSNEPWGVSNEPYLRGGGGGGGAPYTPPPPPPAPRKLPAYHCPECPPGGIRTIGHPGGQQKRFLPFGHGRDLAAFKGTGSFQDRAELSKG